MSIPEEATASHARRPRVVSELPRFMIVRSVISVMNCASAAAASATRTGVRSLLWSNATITPRYAATVAAATRTRAHRISVRLPGSLPRGRRTNATISAAMTVHANSSSAKEDASTIITANDKWYRAAVFEPEDEELAEDDTRRQQCEVVRGAVAFDLRTRCSAAMTPAAATRAARPRRVTEVKPRQAAGRRDRRTQLPSRERSSNSACTS